MRHTPLDPPPPPHTLNTHAPAQIDNKPLLYYQANEDVIKASAASFSYFPSEGPYFERDAAFIYPSDEERDAAANWWADEGAGQSSEEMGPNDGGEPGVCVDCILHSLTFTTKISPFATQLPDFKMYPFDQHTIGYVLHAVDSDIFSCNYIFGR